LIKETISSIKEAVTAFKETTNLIKDALSQIKKADPSFKEAANLIKETIPQIKEASNLIKEMIPVVMETDETGDTLDATSAPSKPRGLIAPPPCPTGSRLMPSNLPDGSSIQTFGRESLMQAPLVYARRRTRCLFENFQSLEKIGYDDFHWLEIIRSIE
jgi:hypothetical protein